MRALLVKLYEYIEIKYYLRANSIFERVKKIRLCQEGASIFFESLRYRSGMSYNIEDFSHLSEFFHTPDLPRDSSILNSTRTEDKFIA